MIGRLCEPPRHSHMSGQEIALDHLAGSYSATLWGWQSWRKSTRFAIWYVMQVNNMVSLCGHARTHASHQNVYTWRTQWNERKNEFPISVQRRDRNELSSSKKEESSKVTRNSPICSITRGSTIHRAWSRSRGSNDPDELHGFPELSAHSRIRPSLLWPFCHTSTLSIVPFAYKLDERSLTGTRLNQHKHLRPPPRSVANWPSQWQFYAIYHVHQRAIAKVTIKSSYDDAPKSIWNQEKPFMTKHSYISQIIVEEHILLNTM